MTKFLSGIHQRGALFSLAPQGKDVVKITVPPDEVFHSCRLTILDAHFGGTAKLDSVPQAGKAGKCEVVVAWQCEGIADVTYQIEAFSSPAKPATGAPPFTTRQMTGFLPSRNGWPFDNLFESVPPIKLIGELKYGDASKGLCGGMVYAALDYYAAGLDIPRIPEKDLSLRYKSPLHGVVFDYFGKRLFNSFDIPAGVWNYIELMNPGFPDFQARKSNLGAAPRSRAWRCIRQEWPIIKSKLDMGHPCPLGLIRIKSNELSRLGENHQVLAYGYDLTGSDLTLFIYDPNYHQNDNITLRLNIEDPERKLTITYWDGQPVLCFFQTNYTFSMPPASSSMPGRIILFEDENFCGRSIEITGGHSDLSTHKAGNFNNFTSSIMILSGKWSFYKKAGFDAPILKDEIPIELGPGAYRRVSDYGIQDNEITSLRAVPTRVVTRRR